MINKKQLFEEFYKKSEKIYELDWEDVLKRDYRTLCEDKEDIIEAITVYCIWNRNTTRIKNSDYEYARSLLLEEECI